MNELIDKEVPEKEEERDYESKVQNQRLIDDILFRNVMDEPKLISKLISAVLGRYVEIAEVTVEKTITNGAVRERRKIQAELDEKDRNIAEKKKQMQVVKDKLFRFLSDMPASEETDDMMAMIASIQ